MGGYLENYFPFHICKSDLEMVTALPYKLKSHGLTYKCEELSVVMSLFYIRNAWLMLVITIELNSVHITSSKYLCRGSTVSRDGEIKSLYLLP